MTPRHAVGYEELPEDGDVFEARAAPCGFPTSWFRIAAHRTRDVVLSTTLVVVK